MRNSARKRWGRSGWPIIGVTADNAGHPEEQGEAAYMVRRNYLDAIARVGGLAVILPYDLERAVDYAARIDGLLVTGGRFDLPPQWYGGRAALEGLVVKEERSLAERALVGAALERDIPVLGVCNGMQLLGVMHGAPVVEHIPTEVPNALDHMAPERPHEARHEVVFEPGTRLRTIVGVSSTQVNSVHHQAVRGAPGVNVAAVASDGVVEAIEISGRRFCYGLQWHPEYGVSSADDAILAAFIAAAAGRPA